jgi:hypothetical protein
MLYYSTVNKLLKESSINAIKKIFDDFRLVGGTALSLQIGHRESIDIDLFSDDYGSLDFRAIEIYLKITFNM